MRRVWSLIVLSTALAASAATAPAALASSPGLPRLPGLGFLRHYALKHACDKPSAGHAMCNAILATPSTTGSAVSPAVSPLASVGAAPPYTPLDLQAAYDLPNAAATSPVTGQPVGSGETVAIVDAYNDPDAAADLATYRAAYGLSACTVANGCFRQVNQTGKTTGLPSNNSGWSQEISLDLDMVSAICPNCHILLVEATSTSFANLGTAVNEAAALGATQISNSYGGGESSGESGYSSSYYNHPGIDVTASSGDDGYGVEFPAASQYVTAVGGTSLTPDSSARGWTEKVWSTSTTEGAGSGCSAYIAKPSWQHDTGCSKRTVADVSAVADPATGVAVYDSYADSGMSGWLQFGGTSVASPIIASVDALANGRSGTKTTPTYGEYAYANPTQFNDVTTGANGTCSVTYLCTGEVGYDGPTGIGTPNGAGPVVPTAPVPVISTSPTISGSPVQGQTLSASTGTWTNSPTSYTYQWSDCSSTSTASCTSLGATATSSTYTVPAGYAGYISVAVTAHNSGGPSVPAPSPTVGPVTELAPVNSAPPTISGSAVQGQTLSASTGTWTNSPTAYAYQWYDCTTASSSGCASLGTSATSSTYTLPTGYTGYVTVAVTASNTGGPSAPATASPAFGPVTAKPLQSFTLTASPTTRSVSAGSSTTYTITVGKVNNFAGSVAFSASGLPTGVTAAFSPTTSTTKTTLTLKSAKTSPTGAHTIQVTGTSAGVASVSLSVNLTLTASCSFFCF